ncbi:hypothetical protein C3L33_11947, partial [Rhododendron williamsianum]
MNPKPDQPNPAPVLPAITLTAGAQRRIAIAVSRWEGRGDGEEGVGEEVDQLHPVPEEELEYHDADDEQKDRKGFGPCPLPKSKKLTLLAIRNQDLYIEKKFKDATKYVKEKGREGDEVGEHGAGRRCFCHVDFAVTFFVTVNVFLFSSASRKVALRMQECFIGWS